MRRNRRISSWKRKKERKKDDQKKKIRIETRNILKEKENPRQKGKMNKQMKRMIDYARRTPRSEPFNSFDESLFRFPAPPITPPSKKNKYKQKIEYLEATRERHIIDRHTQQILTRCWNLFDRANSSRDEHYLFYFFRLIFYLFIFY